MVHVEVGIKVIKKLFYALLFCTVLVSCNENKGNFILRNNSSESIAEAKVKICGQELRLENVKPKEQKKMDYKVTSDSHFDISITFSSGKKIEKQDGYVTNGMNFKHEILVSDSDVSLKLLK